MALSHGTMRFTTDGMSKNGVLPPLYLYDLHRRGTPLDEFIRDFYVINPPPGRSDIIVCVPEYEEVWYFELREYTVLWGMESIVHSYEHGGGRRCKCQSLHSTSNTMDLRLDPVLTKEIYG